MRIVPATDNTFCILVLGDFLGQGSASQASDGGDWSPLRATPDTVLKLAGLRPRIRVSVQDEGEAATEVEFSTLEDFHPRGLFERLSFFEPLREARDVARHGGPGPAAPDASDGEGPRRSTPEIGGLLDAILDVAEPPRQDRPLRTPEELKAFVRDVVRPHLVKDDSDVLARIAAVDEAASLLLSRVLHDESFQRLEGLWRSLVFLLSRVDTTGKVRVYLVHLPKATLENDLEAASEPAGSRLFSLLASPDLPAPGKRWAVAIGAYDFGFSPQDIHLLGRLARVARAADLPWLSAVELPGSAPAPETGGVVGEEPAANPWEEWARLRALPEAAWLGLTYPRFLLREPYGKAQRRRNDPDFREETASWGDLLWGGGPFLVASLLAQGFAAEGWGFSPERHLESDGMPVGAPGPGGERQPRSLRIPMTPADARRVVDLGVMPLLGFPSRAGVRVGGFHSLSDSAVTPSAWWRK